MVVVWTAVAELVKKLLEMLVVVLVAVGVAAAAGMEVSVSGIMA